MTTISQTQEKRLYERFPSRFPAKIKDAQGSFGDVLHLRDASAEGAKILSREKHYLNDSLALEIDVPDGLSPMNLKGQVVWVKEKDENLFDIGLKFHEISLMHMTRLYKFAVDPIISSRELI